VNEKIEGYFEICRILGLNGEQGVIIPSSNLKHLALKEEVIDAVRNDQFHIWCVDKVEDGIEILTGCRAGNIAEQGTVFYRVNKILNDYAERMRAFEEMEEPEEKKVKQKEWTTDIVSSKY
jgi:predicted ATP-dependent protease